MVEMKYARIIPAPSSGLPAFDATVIEMAPPQIWGPTDPRPTPPIQLPPWAGGWQPGIWGPTDPRPSNPIAGIPGLPGYEPPRPLPEPTMDWEYHFGGWYFIAGPYDKPQPICASNDPRVGNLVKATWKTDGHTGWYFVSGPFDRPLPVCGVEVPPDTEPPTEPPLGDNCHWTYTAAGWTLCCGPYDKPKPPTP